MGAVEITSCHDNPGQPLLHVNRSDAESGEEWAAGVVIPNPAVGKGGVCSSRSAGQGAATRNGYFIRELQRSRMPQKSRNPPCGELAM
ncbi:MAG: hypothetical protein BGO99_03530 [Nitrosospira sp. 56-18]|nr:hypothetical protein [Nitrosospira sp.]OJY09336.1 MAG: hypothetical protein BGO99_03530 [Nitrosospira sp. 56-18]